MCPQSQRADALNAITLVENVARLATQGLFGFIFSALAEQGKSYITFFCNAVSFLCGLYGSATFGTNHRVQAVAVLGMGVLLFSYFPPDGSTLVEEDELGESEQDTE
jgi:hypothetical protein